MKQDIDVLCAGLATFDIAIGPVPGDIMTRDGAMADFFRTGSGGDAVNTAVSLAKLGVDTALCACVGTDSFADVLCAEVAKAGVDISGAVRDGEVVTNSPVVLVEESGERHILRLAKGGNRRFSEKHVSRDMLARSRHLHIASVNLLPRLDGAPLAGLFAEAKAMGLTTSMDATYDKDGLWLEKIRDALPHCDIFIPSLQEASLYSGSSDLMEIKRFFGGYGLKVFGVKLGGDGVFVTDYRTDIRLPSLYRGQPVDTTGAGDAFCAGFLAGRVKGLNLEQSALLGGAQAAGVIAVKGANAGAGDYAATREIIRKAGYSLP